MMTPKFDAPPKAHQWKVVPLSKGQLLDVRPTDVLEGGLFRKCSTYRGGGGYDQFPYICERYKGRRLSEQFIVQLYGCNCDCPYCYVTRAGVWGAPVHVSTSRLIDSFAESKQEVFHLMGGAPALYLPHWQEVVDQLAERHPEAIFHSDLLLTEGKYNEKHLAALAKPNVLLAVDIKGVTREEYEKNTRKKFNAELFWGNLQLIENSNIDFYITFTNVSAKNRDLFWARCDANFRSLHEPNAFTIDLIDYDATPHVDDVPWGKQLPAKVDVNFVSTVK